MSKSYEQVNYLLRLKKQIERKLIIETLQSLDRVIDIKEYRYFGFGSVYFADFILFHKYLNINKMTSIDDKVDDEKRFLFNVPFGFIDFETCGCKLFLEKKLDWNDRLFIWLDYDTCLDKSIIGDVEFIAAKAKPFDIVLVTIEGESPKEPDEILEDFRLYIPASSTRKAIKEDFPRVLNHIIQASIQNGMQHQIGDVCFLQLFNLTYRDTKKMYTFGGMFCDVSMVENCKEQLTRLHYIRHENEVIKIDCPLLTPREKMYLDQGVQRNGINDVTGVTGLKRNDVDRYRLYYKYYPQFFESIY